MPRRKKKATETLPFNHPSLRKARNRQARSVLTDADKFGLGYTDMTTHCPRIKAVSSSDKFDKSDPNMLANFMKKNAVKKK